MKIAFLLLTHKNPVQTAKLINRLCGENSDVFVHIDKKCTFGEEEIINLVSCPVYFTENRYDIGLYEFSMIEAERELIETAKKHGSYDYYALLSGQCYPIETIDNIAEFLEKKYPEPFIEIISPKKDNYVRINYSRVFINKRFILRSYASLKKKLPYKLFRVLRYIPGGIAGINSLFKEIIFGSPKKRLERMGMKGYCGSQWWILPDKAIDAVSELIWNKDYCLAMYDVYSCDESFFQTAVMSGEARELIVTDENGDFKNSMWYYDFVDGSHPRAFTKDDCEAILNSGKLFARKLDMDVDKEIFSLIDNAKK